MTNQLLDELLASIELNESVALVTVVRATGSYAGTLGSRALVWLDKEPVGDLALGGITNRVLAEARQCLAEHRRSKSFQKKADEILKRKSQVQIKTADKNLIATEELEIVRDSLKKLDDDLLGPVVLRYFCDMNSNEISEVLQQNPSTIRGRLREARMILAKKLLERGVQP